ncbi:protein NRT1/ PTR FAMILY 5.15-like [Camellia sinensis]|uniref:protein NRT1/ PTR FAMILY 5.15-like n=1 Tax=Camellia sinensis TaxID=4442 RepID=UPI001036B3D7|nr:protein NRT1/ PTR FAMILY 5.15-like [Camellia sinensis]
MELKRRIQGWFKYQERQALVVLGLIYSNSMAVYVLTNLVTFLTHFWKLKLKHAVAIMNIKGGAAGIIGLVEAALIDAYFGHAGMLLITSVLYSIGLGLLVMSVPGRFFPRV